MQQRSSEQPMEEDEVDELVSPMSNLSLDASNLAAPTGEVNNPELDPNAPSLTLIERINPENRAVSS